MTFAAEISAEALAVIVEFGEPVTWRSITRAYSPSTASTTETPTEYAVKVAVEPEEQAYSGNDTARGVGLRVYLPALDSSGTALAFTPSLADRVVGVDGSEFAVTLVNAVRVQGVVVLYDIQLRR